VRVEVRNGSGDTTLTVGAAGKVHVRAEVRAGSMFGDDTRRVEQVTSNPPIDLTGSLLRIGPTRVSNVRITYNIEVPADAILDVHSGSGDVEAHGVEGPVKLGTGSGEIRAWDVRQAAEVSTGSGDVTVRDISGTVDAHTGSGEMRFESVRGDLRARTGSGDVDVAQANGRIDVRTGSGEIQVTGAGRDLRLHTSSGDCDVEGNPSGGSLWEIETGSGDITLDVPSSASFQLHVIGHTNRVDTDIPMVTEESTKRELRGRLGNGEARVRVETSSGSVKIR
jgi:DUF4097 and DUF4098 domain-containing protein YvlB